MSLIICSECGKEISNKAKACVHCGAPIEASTSTQSAVQKDQTEQQETIQSTEEDRSIVEDPNPILLTGKILTAANSGSYGKIQADSGQEYEYLYESVKDFDKVDQHRGNEVRISVLPGSNRVQSVEILSNVPPVEIPIETNQTKSNNNVKNIIATAIMVSFMALFGAWYIMRGSVPSLQVATSECLRFAEDNPDMFFSVVPNSEVIVGESWIIHRNRVVELRVPITEGGQFTRRLCVLNNQRVLIPSFFNEDEWIR